MKGENKENKENKGSGAFLLKSHFAETTADHFGRREVILSEYLKP